MEIDLEIMLHLATLMERHVEEIALHRPVKIVEEFARLMSRELDYTIEAASMPVRRTLSTRTPRPLAVSSPASMAL